MTGLEIFTTVHVLISLIVNVFVLVVQSFRRVPVLKALAPTESEPPFAIAQLAALAAFVVLGYLAARGFVRAAPGVGIVQGSHT